MPPHEDRYDAIVVGGGPAGSAFVRSLRDLRPETRILLVDRAYFPRDKVCGDALTHDSSPLLAEIFPELHDRLPTQSFTRRYTLHYPGGHVFSREDQQLDVVPREQLDHLLLEASLHEGVELMEGTKVVDVVRTGTRVTGVVAERSGERFELHADLVLAADGSGSVLRRRTRVLTEEPPFAAVRQYVDGVPPTDDGLVFVIDPEHHGYFWFFPIASPSWSANIGWFGHQRHGARPRERLEWFLSHDPVVNRYLGTGARRGTPAVSPLNLAPLRRGGIRPVNPLWGDGFLLLGDAASLVHPFTGEGISFALHSGRSAAQLVATSTATATIGPRYQQDALAFLDSHYSLTRTALLFDLPCRIPPRLRPTYLRLLPTLDRARKGVKQVRGLGSRGPSVPNGSSPAEGFPVRRVARR